MRIHWNTKITAESCRKISVFSLKDLFCGFRSCRIYWQNADGEETASIEILVDTQDTPFIRFRYAATDRETGPKTDYDYQAGLTTTPCRFGGQRYWFLCPDCDGRVGCLYMAPTMDRFLCRHCNHLTYESRNERRLGRLGQLGQAIKAERQLEELKMKAKRWAYRGKSTKKARRINALTKRIKHFS